jgi:hypothetical protein
MEPLWSVYGALRSQAGASNSKSCRARNSLNKPIRCQWLRLVADRSAWPRSHPSLLKRGSLHWLRKKRQVLRTRRSTGLDGTTLSDGDVWSSSPLVWLSRCGVAPRRHSLRQEKRIPRTRRLIGSRPLASLPLASTRTGSARSIPDPTHALSRGSPRARWWDR